jgi:glutathione S-transferase
MRKLYHFPTSPFSRRVRLGLAQKGLSAELLDARANPELRVQAKKYAPLCTVPVLVEADGRALGDSTAIMHYLDRAYADGAPLWPSAKDEAQVALDTTSIVDGALTLLVDVGTRYYALRDSPAWKDVSSSQLARAQGALDYLGERVAILQRTTLVASGWCAADMALYTAIAWFEGLSKRAPTFAPAAQLISLGWKVPDALTKWADAHRDRPDVRALDA